MSHNSAKMRAGQNRLEKSSVLASSVKEGETEILCHAGIYIRHEMNLKKSGTVVVMRWLWTRKKETAGSARFTW